MKKFIKFCIEMRSENNNPNSYTKYPIYKEIDIQDNDDYSIYCSKLREWLIKNVVDQEGYVFYFDDFSVADKAILVVLEENKLKDEYHALYKTSIKVFVNTLCEEFSKVKVKQ